MGHSRTGDIAGQQGLQIAGTPEQRRQVKPGRKELTWDDEPVELQTKTEKR
jgi:hypothetical protein